ncbi:inositol monophosphatase [Halobaculum sp. MBLA0147]|uniref:inositol monophosphatase family protein n=1 Tax=Halobaculum sp. MBLA0147 TaxID=3079934 RepID=UPI003524BD55
MSVDRVELCHEAAAAGAERAAASFRTGIAAESKGGDGVDSVTEADRAAQATVIETIREAVPGEPVVGEEGDAPDHVPLEGAAWVVDPIDGTVNYVGGHPVWCTSVACVVDGETVAAASVAPALGDTYVVDRTTTRRDGEPVRVAAESDPGSFLVNPLYGPGRDHRRECTATCDVILEEFGDLRRYGCAQLVLASVASGGLHAAVSTVALNDWDTVAGVAAVRRAGGRVTDANGDRWEPGATGLVASNDTAHETVVAALDGI